MQTALILVLCVALFLAWVVYIQYNEIVYLTNEIVKADIAFDDVERNRMLLERENNRLQAKDFPVPSDYLTFGNIQDGAISQPYQLWKEPDL